MVIVLWAPYKIYRVPIKKICSFLVFFRDIPVSINEFRYAMTIYIKNRSKFIDFFTFFSVFPEKIDFFEIFSFGLFFEFFDIFRRYGTYKATKRSFA